MLRPDVSIYDGRALIVGDYASIGNGTYIGGGPVTIGANVRMARYVIIETYNHNFDSIKVPIRLQDGQNEPVVIEEDVWIGVRVSICPGVRIGRGSVIGAGSVVTRDIPEYSVAAGVPARVIRSRNSQQHAEPSC
jgi:maltose O-acetyltransferase